MYTWNFVFYLCNKISLRDWQVHCINIQISASGINTDKDNTVWTYPQNIRRQFLILPTLCLRRFLGVSMVISRLFIGSNNSSVSESLSSKSFPWKCISMTQSLNINMQFVIWFRLNTFASSTGRITYNTLCYLNFHLSSSSQHFWFKTNTKIGYIQRYSLVLFTFGKNSIEKHFLSLFNVTFSQQLLYCEYSCHCKL